MSGKILVGYPLEQYKEFLEILAPLRKRFKLVVKDYTHSWLTQNIHNFYIIVPSLKVVIDEKLINRAKSLRYIFTPTTGLDHLKFDINNSKVKVWSLQDCPQQIRTVTATAELAFLFILALSRRIVPAVKDVMENACWQRNNFIGSELNQKALGILGLGRIGRRIACYGEGFGMRVIYWDKQDKPAKWERKETVEELFMESDYVVCALKLTPHTSHFVNKGNAKCFKKGCYFVNISRGKVVDENAICQALDRALLAGVGVDVLEEELNDFRKSALYQYFRKHPEKNIVITPHIGGATFDAWRKVFALVVNKILEIAQ
jgi:D-3-phosphoglycerate dehydrogenase